MTALSPMPRPLRALFAVFALGLLAACTTTFDARVQSFQAMPPMAGQSFYIVPKNPDAQAGLEFQSYAALVADELVRNGMVRASSADQAAMLVRMDFGAGPATDRIGSRPMTATAWGWGGRRWSPWGWHPGYWGSFYDPFWGPGWGGGFQNELYAYTTYPAFLHVDIMRQADKAPMFEGRAESATRVNDLPRHMPKLVTALFTEFPGPPSRSQVVRVPL